jgi:hypothetical protein
MQKKKKEESKNETCQRHVAFPSGHPSKYLEVQLKLNHMLKN